MGTRTGPLHILAWQSTLGMMKAYGTRVQWSCGVCKAWGMVDLAPLIDALGEDGSLWDRRPPCKVQGCGGKVMFLASPGPNTPFRPLITSGRRVSGMPSKPPMPS